MRGFTFKNMCGMASKKVGDTYPILDKPPPLSA